MYASSQCCYTVQLRVQSILLFWIILITNVIELNVNLKFQAGCAPDFIPKLLEHFHINRLPCFNNKKNYKAFVSSVIVKRSLNCTRGNAFCTIYIANEW